MCKATSAVVLTLANAASARPGDSPPVSILVRLAGRILRSDVMPTPRSLTTALLPVRHGRRLADVKISTKEIVATIQATGQRGMWKRTTDGRLR